MTKKVLTSEVTTSATNETDLGLVASESQTVKNPRSPPHLLPSEQVFEQKMNSSCETSVNSRIKAMARINLM